jgi:hypothetical protein
MRIGWLLLAPILAIAITLLAIWVTSTYTGLRRRFDFRRFEDRSKKCIERKFPLPPTDNTPAEQRRKNLSAPLDRLHQTANATQTQSAATKARLPVTA